MRLHATNRPLPALAAALCGILLASCTRGNVGPSPLPMEMTGARTMGAAAAQGVYRSIYRFKGGSDGANPFDGLTELDGKFYGVSYGEGAQSGNNGTVFEMTAAGSERPIYHFANSPDGAQPVGTLIAVNGVLYGTTYNGGKNFVGTVFSVTPSGTEHVIYSFVGGTKDGSNPGAGLLEYKGKLYGTTLVGGTDGVGAIFDVTPQGKEHILHFFSISNGDGAGPYAPLIAFQGKLYGTTYDGGANRDGCVYDVQTNGKEHVLYSFTGATDGGLPRGALLVVGDTLYGTTAGDSGTIFSVSLAGKLNTLYSFKGAPTDGGSPMSGLTRVNGTFYGTTRYGGAHGGGTIFSFTEAGTERMLYSFEGGTADGAQPYGPLLWTKGTLYGTTITGGVADGSVNYPQAGTIFTYKP